MREINFKNMEKLAKCTIPHIYVESVLAVRRKSRERMKLLINKQIKH